MLVYIVSILLALGALAIIASLVENYYERQRRQQLKVEQDRIHAESEVTEEMLAERRAATAARLQQQLARASEQKAQQRQAKELAEIRAKAKAYNITPGHKLGNEGPQYSMTDEELEAELSRMPADAQLRYRRTARVNSEQQQLQQEVDRNIRREQDLAYARSLQEDQLRTEREQRRQEAEAAAKAEDDLRQKQAAEAANAHARRLETLAATMAQEPAEGEDGVMQLVMETTNKQRYRRRFRQTDTVQTLVDYLELQGLAPGSYELRRRMPALVLEDRTLSIEAAGLHHRDLLLCVSN
eukprot:TRINITY_DN7701_c0_g1_i5.p1 TRINITY_DN7701_c0_g1~~TRINITY_DN7701_c0_g1_i5.p1  ORF type:complete len:298 (+),score=60.59 TRINITY_DN7701_c0_g1_i5:110-1003(+)